MNCCNKIKNIVVGYKNLAFNVKYEFTDERIRICHSCKESFFTSKKLFCKRCGCFLPAKARVPEETCPLGRWPSADSGLSRIFRTFSDSSFLGHLSGLACHPRG